MGGTVLRAQLRRFHTTDAGTFGVLSVGTFQSYSGECPWRDNAQGLSCIPPGVYKVAWSLSPRLKRNTYRLIDVPERAGVLIHSANYMGDRTMGLKCQLLGCIALGEKRGTMDGQAALLMSYAAVSRFERYMDGQPFELEVGDA
jgi:hypothetical protein